MHPNRTLGRAQPNQSPHGLPDRCDLNRPRSAASDTTVIASNTIVSITAASTYCPESEELDPRLDRCDCYTRNDFFQSKPRAWNSEDTCSLRFRPSGKDSYSTLGETRFKEYKLGEPCTETQQKPINEIWNSRKTRIFMWKAKEYAQKPK